MLFIGDDKVIDTLMYKEIMEQPQRIEDCYQYNKEIINTIVDAIKNFKPQNIIIVGRGTSTHAGIYARYLLETFYHIPVSMASQSVFTIYDSYTDMSKSLVIGLSQSGSGQDTLRVLEKAKESGALVISIVNNIESVIAKIADYVLFCNAGEAVALPATKTFTTTLFLITQLVEKLTGAEILKVTKDDIVSSIKSAFNYDELLDNLIKLFVKEDNLFVLGRGITLALAMETALKIEETSRIHVSSYPIAEFYHGPIAMTNNIIPTILLDIEKETHCDVLKIFDRLKENNIPTLVISNHKEMKEIADHVIIIEESNKIKTFFTATVIIQLLACKLAVAKGYNPDASRQLLNIKTF